MSSHASRRALDISGLSPIGVGLKPQHYRDILDSQPAIGWFEVHPENYMCAGGPPHRYLTAIRADYPLAMHSVGLSLGSVSLPDRPHLARFKELVDRYEPFLVSDHVSWSRGPSRYHTDLLPIPYTREALDILCRNVDIAQESLGRRLLMENPSTYVEFTDADMDEPAFLRELVTRTGCGLLLDVNNVQVCARNHGGDAKTYLDKVPWDAVQEIHLAGHAVEVRDGHELCIDDHGSPVRDDVWDLYRHALSHKPQVPTLIEWDTGVPPLADLMAEVSKARDIYNAQPC